MSIRFIQKSTSLEIKQISYNGEMHQTNTKQVYTCLKQSVDSSRTKLDKSRLVLNYPVNSCHTKLDKS